MYLFTSKTPGKDLGGLDVARVFDGGLIDLETGEFHSSAIPTGDYVFTLEAQKSVPEERLKFSTPILPDYRESMEISVPERGGKEFDIGSIGVLNDDKTYYRTQAPARVTFASDETARILDNKTVQFSLPGPAWSEASMHFQFDEPTTVERVLLWVLPDERLPHRRLSRNGKGKLMLFDLKPELRDFQSGRLIKSRDVVFSYCKSPFFPDEEFFGNLIDRQSDTGWEIPLKENGVASSPIELEFFFRSPVLVTPGEELVLTLDSGGDGENLDTPALIKVAMTGSGNPDENEKQAASPVISRRKAPQSYLDQFQAEKWSDRKLGYLPFGPAHPSGLRVARYFEPRQKVYEMGSQVSGRIVFHNSGTEAVEFTTEDWHQRGTWHCRNATGDEVRPDVAERMGFRAYPTFRLDVKETSWSYKEVPRDFGGAPQLVRETIEKQRRLVASFLFEGRTIEDWNRMLGSAGIRSADRESLVSLGYGTAEVPVPKKAIPMLLALVDSGEPATRCRCLGILRKLDDPGDEVLDTVMSVLVDPKGGGNTARAGYVLGYFPERADYTVPRLIDLMKKQDGSAREAVAMALGRIGPAAKEALPALEALRSDVEGRLREVITRSIDQIRSEQQSTDVIPEFQSKNTA